MPDQIMNPPPVSDSHTFISDVSSMSAGSEESSENLIKDYLSSQPDASGSSMDVSDAGPVLADPPLENAVINGYEPKLAGESPKIVGNSGLGSRGGNPNTSTDPSPRGPGRRLVIVLAAIVIVLLALVWGSLFIIMRHQISRLSAQSQQSATVVKTSAGQAVKLPSNVKFNNLTVVQNATTASLQSSGNISSKGTIDANQFTINGAAVCVSGGCTPSAGSGNYIQNNASKQVASLYLQSTSAKVNGLVVQGQSGQTADLLELQNSGGQVLARVNSQGGLTVSAATVGGGLSAGGNLTVKGSGSISGGLSVGGGASFGGDISVSGHYIAGGPTPSVQIGGAASSGSSISINGTDTLGEVVVTTGPSTGSTGMLFRVNFSRGFGAAPYVVVSPASQASASSSYFVTGVSSSGFSVYMAAQPYGSSTYTFNYFAGN